MNAIEGLVVLRVRCECGRDMAPLRIDREVAEFLVLGLQHGIEPTQRLALWWCRDCKRELPVTVADLAARLEA